MAALGKKTILVCGGAGFIGSNFIRYLLADKGNYHVVCFDALTYSGNKDNLAGLPRDRFTLVKGDIADTTAVARVFKKWKPEFVANFAAETHVDRSIHGDTLEFVRTNIEGVVVLLDAVKNAPYVKKFVHVSTDEVYGALSLSGGKFTENSPLRPNSPYAASKAAGDLMARSFFETYDTPVVITRGSNTYGPYQHPEKLIPYSISRLLSSKPIALYGDGKYVRDWFHVEDHCSGIALALFKGKPGEVYNIGASDELDNLTLAKRMVKILGKNESAISFVKDRPGHDRRYALDARKIKKELGWKPTHSLAKSFAPTVQWYLDHQDWVQRALKRDRVNTHIN